MNDMYKERIISIFLMWRVCLSAVASGTRHMTLDEAIMLARLRSVDASVALNELRTSYWQYRTYRADMLPEISFQGTLPNYTKNYSAYQLEDGSYTFIRNNYLGLNGKLSIDQNIPFTGGRLSIETSLDYLRMLDGGKAQRFMSVPVALTLDQPIFGVNTLKWDRKIEPVRYREAQAKFLQSTEEVAMAAINSFFNLLMAKTSVAVAQQNFDNAVKLYEVAQAKREMGQISKNDLLQLELNRLEAKSALTDAQSAYKERMFALRAFLDMEGDVEIDPVLPSMVDVPEMIYGDVLDKAMANNAFSRNLRRRQLEADYQVAKAKGDMRQITLYAQVGYTGTDKGFSGSYSRLKDNQVVEVGVKIPILDWGKRRGAVKVAESNREVVATRLRKETMDFRQDLFILVERFNNQRQQVEIAVAADGIAARRYDANVQTFMLGKISTLDLNDSQVKKDEARSEYISQLFRYWYYYYQLRSLTLWDFEHGTNIDADFNALIK